MARIQTSLRKLVVNLGYHNRKEIWPRNITERSKAFYLHSNHFCLICKSQNVSFIQATEEKKDNSKTVDFYRTQEIVKSHFDYIYQPKKIELHLANFITYVLETHNTDKGRHYVFCFYRLRKLACRYNRNLTHDEIQKCNNDTIAFDGDECVTEALDFCLKLRGQERKDNKNKILEHNLQFHAHKGSGFDTWIVLNNLPCDKTIVDIIKNGKSIIDLKGFIGYIQNNKKQIPQYLHFRCGMTHFNYSLKKLGRPFKLQKDLLTTEMNQDEIEYNNYRHKKDE